MTGEDKIENLIEKCLLYTYSDMFFSALYRRIILSEYEKIGKLYEADLEEVAKKHIKLTAVIFHDSISNFTNLYSDLRKEEIDAIRRMYPDIIKYVPEYRYVNTTFVLSSEKHQQVLQQYLNDTSPIFPLFFQRCMVISGVTAMNRINKKLSSKEYFDYEIVVTDDSETIKIFLTPYGALMQRALVDMQFENEFRPVLEQFLLKNGLTRIEDESLKKDLNTSFIYSSKNDSIFYYKKRPIDDYYMTLGEQNRKNPIKSLLVQGQLNLTKYTS